MYKFQTVRNGTFILAVAACGCLFTSCTEKISGVGSGFLRDTISSGISTFNDLSAFSFQSVIRRSIISSGRTFAINSSASAMFIGKVAVENLEVWAAMKTPILTSDVGQLLTDTLILRMRFPFHYGDPTDKTIDFSVYTEVGNLVNDSTTTLTKANLGATPVGSYQGSAATTDTLTIKIPLDTAVLNPLLRTASLALVLVPNAPMNTIRAFASSENGDSTYSPTLKFRVKGANDTTTLLTHPTKDFHIVISDNSAPAGEFLLRGSYASRERVVINIKNIRNQLRLSPFTTVNSALLEVRSDGAMHSVSDQPVDSTGPSLAYIPNTTVADSGHSFVSYGTKTAADPSVYFWQVQSLVEHALRVGDDSLVLELRAGFVYRLVNGATVDVEDINVNRWMLYGMDNADKSKRPKLVLTYSLLR